MSDFTMDSAKAQRVSSCLTVRPMTAQQVEEYCTDDSWGYDGFDEHQDWLNAAPESEIADWIDEHFRDIDPNTWAVSFQQFDAEIRRLEQQLAPGSETSVYGDFVNRMSELAGDNWRESDAEVPADEVAGWRKVYELVEADLQLPADEQATDVSEFYNRAF